VEFRLDGIQIFEQYGIPQGKLLTNSRMQKHIENAGVSYEELKDTVVVGDWADVIKAQPNKGEKKEYGPSVEISENASSTQKMVGELFKAHLEACRVRQANRDDAKNEVFATTGPGGFSFKSGCCLLANSGNVNYELPAAVSVLVQELVCFTCHFDDSN
jgi:hypothetical protein